LKSNSQDDRVLIWVSNEMYGDVGNGPDSK